MYNNKISIEEMKNLLESNKKKHRKKKRIQSKHCNSSACLWIRERDVSFVLFKAFKYCLTYFGVVNSEYYNKQKYRNRHENIYIIGNRQFY